MKTELIMDVLMIILIIVIIIYILYWLGTQIWVMQFLKNKCIVECLEFNKLNNNTVCVC